LIITTFDYTPAANNSPTYFSGFALQTNSKAESNFRKAATKSRRAKSKSRVAATNWETVKTNYGRAAAKLERPATELKKAKSKLGKAATELRKRRTNFSTAATNFSRATTNFSEGEPASHEPTRIFEWRNRSRAKKRGRPCIATPSIAGSRAGDMVARADWSSLV